MTTTEWDLVTQALIKVVILAFLVERALAVVFDMEKVEPFLKRKDLKPTIAIVVSVLACFLLKIDAISPLGDKGAFLANDSAVKWLGYLLTGLVVAGGSVGAIKLFQDILGFRRSSRDQLKAVEAVNQQAEIAEAQARLEKAKADIAGAQASVTAAVAGVITLAGDTPEQQILAARIAERDLKLARGG